MKALIVIILVAIAGYLGYRILSKPKPGTAPVTETQPAPERTTAPPAVVTSKAPVRTNVTKAAITNKPAARVRTPGAQPTGEWKAKMDLILGSNASAQQKIQDLREMLSKLQEADAEQAVQELTSRVKDEGFSFLKPLVVDPTLPEPVRDEFMVDLMNRPNSIKVPLCLEIARNPDHPDHESAFDTLEAFTGLKYGADWNGWEKGIQQWLKENPDKPRRSQQPQPEAN